MEVSVWHQLVFIVYMYVCNGYESTCPSVGHWNFRANSICPKIDQYTCLFDVSKGQYVENCKGPRIEVQGQKTTINNNYLNTEKCSKKRYQPIDFSTVRATSCIYQKSECVEEGQYTILNESKRSTVEDATCGCNSNKGFILMSEMNKCSCTPSVEDCSCMRRRPDLNSGISNIYIEKCSSPFIPENRDKDQDKITKYQVGSNIKRPGFSNKAAGTVVFIIVLILCVFPLVLWKTTQIHYLEEREMREDMHAMRSYDETKMRNSSHLKCDKTRFGERTNNDDKIKGKVDTTNLIDKSSKESDIDDDNDGNDDEIKDVSARPNFSNENGKKLKPDDVSNKPSKVNEESFDEFIANPNVTKPKEQNTDDEVGKTDSRQASYLECDKTSSDGIGTAINESIESKDTSTDAFQSCTNIQVIGNQETTNNDDIIKEKEDTTNFIDKSSKEGNIADDNDGNDDEYEDASDQINFSNENGKKLKPDNVSNTPIIHDERSFEKILTELYGKNNDQNTDKNYEKENADGNAGKKKTVNNLTNQNICYSSKKKNTKDNSERENTEDIVSLETDNIDDSPAKESTNDSLEMNKTNDSPMIEHKDDSLKQGNTTDSIEKEKSSNSAEKENTNTRPERETPSDSPKNKKTDVSGEEDTTGNCQVNTVEYPETEKPDYSPGEQKMAQK